MRGCSAVILLSALDIVAGCERRVAAQATQARITPRFVKLAPLQNLQFTAFGLTSAGDTVRVGLIWSVEGAGSVSSSGLYSATTPGEGAVCIRVGPGGIPDCATVQVLPEEYADTLEAFTTKRVMPDVSGKAMTWTASAGRITPSGLYTAPASAGEYQVCVQVPEFLRCERVLVTSPSSPHTIVAAAREEVESVIVSPGAASASVGQRLQLAATVKARSGMSLTERTISWGTSNSAVAFVDGSGLVTTIAPGAATITATSEGTSGTSTITVSRVPVASVSVTPASASLQVGQTLQLAATVNDANGNPIPNRVVTWASGDTMVASLSSTGLVTGRRAGPATIAATSEGKSGTATVTVKNAPTRRSMNAADSVRWLRPQTAVAVAVPVTVLEDSDVIVRLIIDPSQSARALGDSLASERAAGMDVEPGTAFYGPSMIARLGATGADVSLSTEPVVAVTGPGLTGWTWKLIPKKPGRQRLWITMTEAGVTRAGGESRKYYLARDYTIRRNWLGNIGVFVWQYWKEIGGLLLASLLSLRHYLKRRSRKSAA